MAGSLSDGSEDSEFAGTAAFGLHNAAEAGDLELLTRLLGKQGLPQEEKPQEVRVWWG